MASCRLSLKSMREGNLRLASLWSPLVYRPIIVAVIPVILASPRIPTMGWRGINGPTILAFLVAKDPFGRSTI